MKATNEVEKDIDTKAKVLSFFLLFFPSIMLVIAPDGIQGFIIKFCLLFYQFVVLNNFVKKFYGDE